LTLGGVKDFNLAGTLRLLRALQLGVISFSGDTVVRIIIFCSFSVRKTPTPFYSCHLDI
jgi:hypothetical protein